MGDQSQAIGIIRLQRCQAASAFRLIREYLGPDDPTVAEVYREIDRQLVILGNVIHASGPSGDTGRRVDEGHRR